MPIDPIIGPMLTLLTTPPFADRSLRHKLNKLLTGKDAYLNQLKDAWKAGRKAFALAVETSGYTVDATIQARFDQMFAHEVFAESAGKLLFYDLAEIDQEACRKLFHELVLPDATALTFDAAWRMLGVGFYGTVSQSPELKNLIDLSREARREEQEARRNERGQAMMEKQTQLVEQVEQLMEQLLAKESVQQTQVSVDNKIEIHLPAAPDPHAASREQLRNYLGWVMKEAGALWLSGIDRRDAVDEEQGEISYGSAMRLDAVYTALLTHGGSERDWFHAARADQQAMEKANKPVPALRQLNEQRNLVLLGDPGSGKSTFVNFVALCLAGEARGETVDLSLLTAPLPWAEESKDEDGEEPEESRPQPWNHGALLPLRVVLRDFAARGLPAEGEEGKAEHLWAFIAAELAKTSLGEIAPEIKRCLERGEVLVLLDGLDEVPEADARRERLVQAVDDFVAVHGDCRFLVTCRTYAYQHQRWRLRDFAVAVLQPWQPPQIRTFVDRWYAHSAEIGRGDAPAQRAELLKKAIAASPSLSELAERPLLLTLMASLHAWRGGELPEKRVELYDEAVDLLLERWQKRQMMHNPETDLLEPVQPSLAEWLNTDRRAMRRQLERLAFAAHRVQPDLEGTADIAQEELIAALMKERKNADIRYKQLVNFLSQRAGLLVSRGVEVYSFVHRSFQEYLAACYLTRDDFPYLLTELARQEPDRWREVTLLAAAKAAEGAPATVWQVVEQLVRDDESADPLENARAAHLAGLVLAESNECQALAAGERKRVDRHRALFDRLRLAQRENLEGDLLKARDRAECGRSLAIFGDVREPVLTVEAMEWCRVPAGKFRLGSERYPWEKPIHDYVLPYGYWLSRFPITNAQYRAFVEAGGYEIERYWPEAKEHGLWDSTFLREGEPVEGPEDYGEPYDLSNHPVVGVSWYESRAFCCWLTDFLRSASLLSEEWLVDLPSEPEWEKAARGGERIPLEALLRTTDKIYGQPSPEVEEIENPFRERSYPWGEGEDLEKMNVDGTKIESSSAVGCFAGDCSRYGCEEMSGNVWEWTRSVYQKYSYPKVAEAKSIETLANGNISLVLRGGGFAYDPSDAQCSNRDYGSRPTLRNWAVGFRPILRPSAYLYF